MLSPTKPDEKTFEELSKLVQDHLNPEPSEVIQPYKFHSKVRSHGKSVLEFVAELRELSEKCKFGDQLEDMLRDRLVCGVADPVIQKRLLQEKTLQFKKAFELAQALEAAAKNTADLQGSTIHKLGQQIYRAVQYINLGSKVLNPNPGKGIIRGSQLKKAPLMNVTDVGEVTNHNLQLWSGRTYQDKM